MAHDRKLATALRGAARAALDDAGALEEGAAFGGMALSLRGRLICGVKPDALGGGAFFNVGETGEAEALGLPGARAATGLPRPLPGYVEVTTPPGLTPGVLAWLMDLALEHAAGAAPDAPAAPSAASPSARAAGS